LQEHLVDTDGTEDHGLGVGDGGVGRTAEPPRTSGSTAGFTGRREGGMTDGVADGGKRVAAAVATLPTHARHSSSVCADGMSTA
jgi:hypothetical protein